MASEFVPAPDNPYDATRRSVEEVGREQGFGEIVGECVLGDTVVFTFASGATATHRLKSTTS